MSTLKFDFRHYYQKGDRREANKIAYQWDLGHVAEIYVPTNASYEIHYLLPHFTETDDYAIEDITAADDGGYKLIAHIPNTLFESSGELRLYIVGSTDNYVLTTYEGYITIRERLKPEDYSDDDPQNGAESIVQRAREYAQESEAWAVGKIEGTDVPSTADQYQNNSKYYSTQAAGSKDNAEAWAVGTKDGTAVESTDPQYHNNALYHADQASGSASAASGSASTASSQALKAEGYAVGKQNGTDVTSGSDYYQNNASYYSSQASGSATAASGSATAASGSKEQAEAWAIGKINGTDVTSSAAQYHNNAKYYAELAAAELAGIYGIIATVEDDPTDLSQSYEPGEYCIANFTLYRFIKQVYSGDTLVAGTGSSSDNAVQTTVSKELSEDKLWFYNVPVTATTGSIVNIIDSRITKYHVMSEIVWNDSSKITSLTQWSTETSGHFIVTGTASAATTCNVLLVRAGVIEDLDD